MTVETLGELQKEHRAWLEHNFPIQASGGNQEHGIYGTMEELGELCHAVLKGEQGIRDGNADFDDAFADTLIFFTSLCTSLEVPLTGYIDGYGHGRNGICIQDVIVPFSMFLLSRDRTTAASFISALIAFYRSKSERRPSDVINEVWDKVKQRDWIAYPKTGLPPVE